MKSTIVFVLFLSSVLYAQRTGCVSGNCENGEGTYIWSSGTTYTGEWKNGKQHGKGKTTWSDGEWYEGGYNMGERTGWGEFRWKDKTWYRGRFLNGRMNGYGEYHFASGTTYTGQIRLGKFSGVGTKLKNDGTREIGFWKNDTYMGSQRPVLVVSSQGPIKSIQAAIDSATAGDEILIRRGTYNEAIVIDGKENITIRGEGEAWLKVPTGDIITIRNSSGIALFNIKGIHDTRDEYFACETSDVLDIVHSKNIIVAQCLLDGSGQIGLTGYHVEGLLVSHTIVQNCIFGGIVLENCANVTLQYNLIIAQKAAVDKGMDCIGLSLVSSKDVVVNHNTVAKLIDFNPVWIRDSESILFTNNIISHNTLNAENQSGLMLGENQTLDYHRNLLWDNKTRDGKEINYDAYAKSFKPLDDINTDPLFLNPQSKQFGLKASSGAINQATDGLDIGAVQTKHRGNLTPKIADQTPPLIVWSGQNFTDKQNITLSDSTIKFSGRLTDYTELAGMIIGNKTVSLRTDGTFNSEIALEDDMGMIPVRAWDIFGNAAYLDIFYQKASTPTASVQTGSVSQTITASRPTTSSSAVKSSSAAPNTSTVTVTSDCKTSDECIERSFKAQSIEEAILYAESAVRLLKPTDEEVTQKMAYRIRAETYLYQFKKSNDAALVEKIEADFEKAIKLDPQDGVPYIGLAKLYEAQNQELMVEDQFARGLQANASPAILYYERSQYNVRQKRESAADEDLDKAIEMLGGTSYKDGVYKITAGDPSVTDKGKFNMYYTRAERLVKKKDYQRAYADLSQAIKFDPENSNAYWLRAKIAIDVDPYYKKPEPALADLNKVIELSPDFADAYYWKGQVLLANSQTYKDHNITIQTLIKASELEPAFSDGYAYAAHLCLVQERNAEAEQFAFLAVQKTDKKNALGLAHYVLGYTYSYKRDRENMLKHFRKSVEYGYEESQNVLKSMGY